MNLYRLITLFGLCVGLGLRLGIAQTNDTFDGYLFDNQTGAPLSGVTVRNDAGVVIGYSDDHGYFTVPAGDGALTFSLLGYRSYRLLPQDNRRRFNIQLETDPVYLSEVRVGLNNQANRRTPGAVALLTADDIRRGSGVSLQQALNTVPGVRMDQSTLSDSRIAIRGNGVRATWGTRAVKIYINDIPVTETDGTTRIEAVDVPAIGRAEVIKGPASTIYGAGAAGVINFQLKRAPYGETRQEFSALKGAFGLNRIATAFHSGGDGVNSYVSYGWQEYGGYRAHSGDMRRFITGNFQFFPSERQRITLLVNRSTQHTQIPGALTQDQAGADPRQANPSNVNQAAGRYQNWTRIGVGQHYQLTERLSNSTSVFSYFYDINHPLPFAYIRNYYQSYGGRTRFTFEPAMAVLATRFTIGGEFNQGMTKGTQYVNDGGTEGAMSSNVDYRNTMYAMFYQSETELGPRTQLTLGIGINSMQYDVQDYLSPMGSGLKQFKPKATPRVALSHTFHQAITLHAGISTGFTPPTSSEIKFADGTINTHLQAEDAVNYEVNVKGSLLANRLSYDLAVFRMNVNGELIAQSIQQGVTVYNNAGKTTHRGAELALSWQAVEMSDNRWVRRLRPYASVTYSDFSFVDYKTLDETGAISAVYDGKQLTGIAPWVISAGIDLDTHPGFYVHGSYFYSDALPLNDANTAYHHAYHLLNVKTGYVRRFGRRIQAEVYGGIDNLMNEQYSSSVSLNATAFGGGQAPYFNPSPGRSTYGGITLSYRFNP